MDELTTNQITAALYERARLLQRAIRRLESQAPSQDRDFAMECNEFALLHTNRALIEVSRRLPAEEELPESADAVTAAKAYAELGYHAAQAAYGLPEGDSDVVAGYAR